MVFRRFGRSERSPTILEHVAAHLDPSGRGLLPGGADLPGADDTVNGVSWGPGAIDGTLSHHSAAPPLVEVAAEVADLIARAVRSDLRPRETGELYERVREERLISYVDALLDALAGSRLPVAAVARLGEQLATTGRHVEPVKLGIALLGLTGGPAHRDLLLTLGRHDELALYCAVALENTQPDPERAVYELARGVDGWGRIHAVERLADTADPEVRDWILREGFRNQVTDQYLAGIAFTTGGLLERLREGEPDDQLLDAAGDVVAAMLDDGPAAGLDECVDAHLLETLLPILDRRATTLRRLLVVDDIDRFLAGAEGWPPEPRDEFRARCAEIKARAIWPGLVAEGLASGDDELVWTARRAAEVLGIDGGAGPPDR